MDISRGFGIRKTEKGPEIMTSEKNMRMEEIGNGQQDMQEKIVQMTKMVENLTKGKGIIDDPNLQRRPTSWKDGIDPSIVPNPNDPCEQKKLRKDLSGRSEHINVQQRCNFLDKKLKEIEGVNDLESVNLRELSLVPDVVIPSKFKIPNVDITEELRAFHGELHDLQR